MALEKADPTELARPRYRLVYLLGAGHCGSTLLDMLLGGHPQIMALGEVSGIHRFWAMATGAASPGPRRQADWVEVSSSAFDHPIWRSAAACYTARVGEPMDRIMLRHPSWAKALRWSPDQVGRWAERSVALFDCLQAASGRPILTDASKRPVRLYLLARSRLLNLAVIHLRRDGRGVMYSYLRKYGRWGVGFRRWAGPTLTSFYVRRSLRDTPWLDVRYEDLATEPRETLQRICAFLGVAFTPGLLDFRGYEYLGVGGNRMREGGDPRIVLDERWKHEWRGPGRVAFTVAGGWLNRLSGY